MGIEIGEGKDVVMQPVYRRPARADYIGDIVHVPRGDWYALRLDGAWRVFARRRDAIAWLNSR